LLDGFRPEVFAADHALFLTGRGMPFRDAYLYVKEHLTELTSINPLEAVRRKNHLGATAGLNLSVINARRAKEQNISVTKEPVFTGVFPAFSVWCIRSKRETHLVKRMNEMIKNFSY